MKLLDSTANLTIFWQILVDCAGVETDMSDLLFEPPLRFEGLPAEGFRVFAIQDREERRRAIINAFHPALHELAEDLLERLGPSAAAPLHAHLPRLDWPRGYQPFGTWLALSREVQGYQAGPQLNVGIHADHVALRPDLPPRSSAAAGASMWGARSSSTSSRMLVSNRTCFTGASRPDGRSAGSCRGAR